MMTMTATTTTTSDPFELAKKVTKQREWAGFKATLRFIDPATGTAINTEVRYGKLDIDPAFSAEGVEKLGPHGGKIRYQRGEWKTFEQMPDGSEVEISEDDIKYYQSADASGKAEVSPFDATKVWDISEQRSIDECTLNGDKALGTLIPREKVDEFGPDKERGSSLYWIDGDAVAFRALAEKLEKDRTALYFPLVLRNGLTIHLAAGYLVRIGGNMYMIMRTFGGSVIWSHPLTEKAEPVAVEKKTPVLAKPVLRRKAVGASNGAQ